MSERTTITQAWKQAHAAHPDASFLGCLWTFAGILPCIAFTALGRGFAISTVWGWFVTPALEVPELPVTAGAGIALIVCALRVRMPPAKEEKDDARSIVVGTILDGVVLPLIVIGAAWVLVLLGLTP